MAEARLVDLMEIECFQCRRPFQVCMQDYRRQRYCGRECRKLGYRACARKRGSTRPGTEVGTTTVADSRPSAIVLA